MKKYIQNQKGKNLFINIQNKKKYRKRSNSIELNENYNDYLSKEKNNHNISDISSYKQIKKIKYISALNKTFYPKNILSHNTNTYIPINLCSMPKTKKYLNSLNKLNYNLKLNKAKTISDIEKTIYNNSNTNNNKIFDYSIYLPDEFRELASYKNIDFKFPKTKDFHNTKIEKRKSFNNTSKFVLSRNNINAKLKINPETNYLNNKENKYISEFNKIYVNIYNPNKILNNKRKSEDQPEISKEFENKEIKKRQYNSLGLSKKQLQNKLYQKIKAKENLTLEQKDESIKNGNKIKEKIILKNKSMKELNHSNIIVPKIIINNNSTILEQKDSIKDFNANDSNKLIKKNNLLKTPKIIQKINEDLPKITNYNYDDSPKSKVHVLPNENNQEYNSIKNGGFFNINKDLNKVNNSSKVVNSFVDKKIEIKEEFIRNNKNYKTSNFFQKSLFINEINTYNIKNKKILNIFPIKTKNTNDKNKNNIFLNKIIKRNQCQNKYLLLNRKVKKYKKSILFNQINNINKIIPNKNIISNSSYEFNIEQIVHQYLEVYEKDNYKDIKNYENIYSELKQASLLNILLYSYRPFIFKCSLDQNIINYLLINNFLSSIFVPLVDCTKRRSALLISNKLFIIQKNITVFEDKKSKFIESKKSKKIFQNISLNFINKELFYLHLNNDSNKKNLMFQSPKKERKIYSYKTNSYKNNSNSISKKSSKKASLFSDYNYIQQLTMNRRIQKISVLQNKKLFEMPNKNKDKNSFLKKIKRRGAVNKENKFERLGTKQSKTYYNLIHNINDLEKINEIYNSVDVLKNLIKKGEVLLFMEYLNNKSRKIDINIQDEDGNTFLILSIKHSLNKLSKILLEKGINVNVQNNDGNTALHYALSGKNFYMADILRKYGANEDFVNKLGYTPWDCIGKNIEIDAIY